MEKYVEKFKQGDLVILKENKENYHLRSHFGMVFTVVSVENDHFYLTSDGKDRYICSHILFNHFERWFPRRLEKVKNTWKI